MDETLDMILSDDSITFIKALLLLRDHLNSLCSREVQEVKEDLMHAFSCPFPG